MNDAKTSELSAFLAQVGQRPLRDIAYDAGVSASTLCRQAQARGLDPYVRVPWQPDEHGEALLGTMPDRLVAEQLRVSARTVARARNERGIKAWRPLPPTSRQRRLLPEDIDRWMWVAGYVLRKSLSERPELRATDVASALGLRSARSLYPRMATLDKPPDRPATELAFWLRVAAALRLTPLQFVQLVQVNLDNPPKGAGWRRRMLI